MHISQFWSYMLSILVILIGTKLLFITLSHFLFHDLTSFRIMLLAVPLIVVFLKLLECSSNFLEFNDIGTIHYKHMVLKGQNVTLSDFEVVKKIRIEFDESLKLLKNGTDYVAKTAKDRFQLVNAETHSSRGNYKESLNFFLKWSPMQISYFGGINYCNSINGKPFQLTDGKALKAIKKLPSFEEGQKIWQEVYTNKNRAIFIPGDKLVPTTLGDTKTAFDAANAEDGCGVYDFQTNTFSFDDCDSTHTVVCQMKITTYDIFIAFLQTNSIKHATHRLKLEIDHFFKMFHSLPSTSANDNFDKFKLFTLAEENVINNLHKANENTLTSLSSQFVEFFQTEQNKLVDISSGLNNFSSLKATFNECCLSLSDAIFSDHNDAEYVLTNPQQIGKDLLLSVSKQLPSQLWKTSTLLPLHVNRGPKIYGLFTSLKPNSCHILPESCTTTQCPKSSLQESKCCSEIISKKESTDCQSASKDLNFIMRNNTHIFVNSKENVNLAWSCISFSTDAHTFLAEIAQTEDCSINSTLPLLPKFSKIFVVNSTFQYEEVIPQENNTVEDSGTMSNVLTYAAFLASVCTILMFIFSLYLFFNNRKTSSQNQNALQEESPIELESIRSILKTSTSPAQSLRRSPRNKKRKSKRKISSTDSEPDSD